MRELIETTESDVPQKSRDDPNTTTDIFDITPPTPLLAVRCESVHGISRSQPGNSFLLYWSELQTLDDNRWTHTVDDARRLRSTHPPYDLLDTPALRSKRARQASLNFTHRDYHHYHDVSIRHALLVVPPTSVDCPSSIPSTATCY